MTIVRLVLKNKHGDGDCEIETFLINEHWISYLLQEIKDIKGTMLIGEWENKVRELALRHRENVDDYQTVTEWV